MHVERTHRPQMGLGQKQVNAESFENCWSSQTYRGATALNDRKVVDHEI
jgi:hypothetical protein